MGQREYAIFDVYLAQVWNDVRAGKAVVCQVLGLDDGATHVVRAKVGTPEQIPEGDTLRVKTDSGEWKGEEWRIQVLEELSPDEVSLPVLPLTARPAQYGGP